IAAGVRADAETRSRARRRRHGLRRLRHPQRIRRRLRPRLRRALSRPAVYRHTRPEGVRGVLTRNGIPDEVRVRACWNVRFAGKGEDMSTTALRICPLCEATCGLTLTIEDGRVTGTRGDGADVLSAGFICPKGASFAELDNDPDRLTRPMVRRDGVLIEATWDEAFAVVADRLGTVIREHGGG